MVPRKPLALGQNSAHPAVARGMSFALAPELDQAYQQAKGHQPDAAVCQDCTPSLLLRPGPPRVGSLFKGQVDSAAKIRRLDTFRCSAPTVALDSGAIATLKRGIHPCINRLLRLLSSWSLPLATVRSTPTARPLGPSVVWRSVLQPITTWRKVPSRAACSGRLPGIRVCAADRLTSARRCGVVSLEAKASKAPALVAFSFAAT